MIPGSRKDRLERPPRGVFSGVFGRYVAYTLGVPGYLLEYVQNKKV